MSKDASLLKDVEAYYTGRVREFGATPRGVDWNSPESQQLRFDQLAKLWDGETRAIDLIDYGCGYGALVEHLSTRGTKFAYQGYDVSAEMIASAKPKHWSGTFFTSTREDLKRADYVVASGIFNVRLKHGDDEWKAYIERTIPSMRALARRGFAFNALTSYSDKDKQRADLYYADPLFWFDHCKRLYSPHVTLVHDYPLYEFTILVRFPETS